MTTALKNEIKKLAREGVREALKQEWGRMLDTTTPDEAAAIKRGRSEHRRGASVPLRSLLHELDSDSRAKRGKKSRKNSV